MQRFVCLCAACMVGGLASAAPSAEVNPDGTPTASFEAKIRESLLKEGGVVFPIGKDNVTYAPYFTGRTFLAPIGGTNVGMSNVTFAPGVVNHWHKHEGSCQILNGVSGRGYYQIWGQEPVELKPGQSATIPDGVKHWHGAAPGSWFQHLATMSAGAKTVWLEPVSEDILKKLK